jgi:hypothetical protein
MTKKEQLKYMRKRFPELDEAVDAVLPVTKRDIEEEASLMESVLEERRNRRANGGLTSDE